MKSYRRFHIPALFSKDFFAAGFTLIPNLLLRYSSRLTLSDMDLLVIFVIFYFQQIGKEEIHLEDFAQILNIPEKQIKSILEGLMVRKLISSHEDYLDTTGLFEKITDLWAEEKVQSLQEARKEAAATTQVKIPERTQTPVLNNLFCIFEQEFGRPLTPMECTQIIRWSKDDGYSEELILEALKRAVLRGVFNLNYIDRILIFWAKKNLRTTQEVLQDEKKYLAQRQQRSGKSLQEGSKAGEREEKYKDLYLT